MFINDDIPQFGYIKIQAKYFNSSKHSPVVDFIYSRFNAYYKREFSYCLIYNPLYIGI